MSATSLSMPSNSYDVLIFFFKMQIIDNAKWIRNKAVLLTHFSSRYHLEVVHFSSRKRLINHLTYMVHIHDFSNIVHSRRITKSFYLCNNVLVSRQIALKNKLDLGSDNLMLKLCKPLNQSYCRSNILICALVLMSGCKFNHGSFNTKFIFCSVVNMVFDICRTSVKL